MVLVSLIEDNLTKNYYWHVVQIFLNIESIVNLTQSCFVLSLAENHQVMNRRFYLWEIPIPMQYHC